MRPEWLKTSPVGLSKILIKHKCEAVEKSKLRPSLLHVSPPINDDVYLLANGVTILFSYSPANLHPSAPRIVPHFHVLGLKGGCSRPSASFPFSVTLGSLTLAPSGVYTGNGGW